MPEMDSLSSIWNPGKSSYRLLAPRHQVLKPIVSFKILNSFHFHCLFLDILRKPGAQFQRPVVFAGATLPLVFPSNLKFCTSQSSLFLELVKATETGTSTLLKPYSSLLM